MKLLLLSVALAAFAGVASARQPETSAQDYLKAIQGAQAAPAAAPVDPGAAAAAGQAAPCADGAERDSHGACPLSEDGPQRGFSLISSSSPKATPMHPARSTVVATRSSGRPTARAHESDPNSLLGSLRIGFRAGSAELTAQGEAELKKFAAALKAAPAARFEIAGHTDVSGSADANVVLSQHRADAVKAFLVAEGVDAGRLDTRGYGAEGLAYPDLPRDPRNRRVEAKLLN
jgi:outer membrane protein OmpA-like peptidoglycan-associated protein